MIRVQNLFLDTKLIEGHIIKTWVTKVKKSNFETVWHSGGLSYSYNSFISIGTFFWNITIFFFKKHPHCITPHLIICIGSFRTLPQSLLNIVFSQYLETTFISRSFFSYYRRITLYRRETIHCRMIKNSFYVPTFVSSQV